MAFQIFFLKVWHLHRWNHSLYLDQRWNNEHETTVVFCNRLM